MTNNDILRRIRYTFDFNDSSMMALFELAGRTIDRATLSNWLKKDDHAEYKSMNDHELALFLDGLIIEKRGRKEGVQPASETKLNNNIIFRKLKIALSLKDEDILDILALADFKFSRHELSAFFRNPGQEQYRVCNDQVLRNFLMGMQLRYKANTNLT